MEANNASRELRHVVVRLCYGECGDSSMGMDGRTKGLGFRCSYITFLLNKTEKKGTLFGSQKSREDN